MLENLKSRINKASKTMLDDYAKDAKKQIAHEAPVDTGNLRDSIADEKKSDDEHLVGVDSSKTTEDGHDYSLDVYYGTGPHVITPKNAQALHFVAGGVDVFAKKVNHPGQKPNKFIDRAVPHIKSPELHL